MAFWYLEKASLLIPYRKAFYVIIGWVGVGTNQVCLSTSLCAKVTCKYVPWGAMKYSIYFSHLTDGKTKEL